MQTNNETAENVVRISAEMASDSELKAVFSSENMCIFFSNNLCTPQKIKVKV
jgi:hypothetical protein